MEETNSEQLLSGGRADCAAENLVSAPGNGKLIVASYNIHRCVGVDRRRDPERIAQVIAELKADIVGLQEIDSLYFKRGYPNQLDFLVKATGLQVVTGPTLRWRGGHYGNALLTSHHIRKVNRTDLSVPGREPRGAIDVYLDVKGASVRVIVTHLGLGFSERHFQVMRLQELLQSTDCDLEIMLGDFNEWLPRRRPLHRIHDYFGKPPASLTFPSFFPVFPLDRIWVRPRTALHRFCAHITPLSRVASDHLPVKATIALDQHSRNAGQQAAVH